MHLNEFDYSSIRQFILSKKYNCKEITAYYLNQINEGSALNAFISVFRERSCKQAEQIHNRLAKGKVGKLAGLVLAVKDNINVQGERTTCASKILSHFISPYHATVIRRLESEGTIIIGKTNMDEFAMGSSNEFSYFQPVKNPLDKTKVPGGSSGGSAAAVAASMTIAALGSDTGGSIRQPASSCGVIGMKPTYGRVSRYGLVAFASSFDQIGPLTKTVADNARILEVIAGFDPKDATTSQIPVPNYSDLLDDSVRELTIGLPDEYFGNGLNDEVKEKILAAVARLRNKGAKIKTLSLPHTQYAVSAYYILANAEASSNLARYDGVHYGYRTKSAAELNELYVRSRTEGFGNEVKKRILLGTYVLSAGYYKKYYQKAQKVRQLIKQDFEQAFHQCDCVITPTTPTTAFRIGEKINDPLTMYLSDVYTVAANLTGLPAMSVPCGQDSQNLPIGLQIMASHFNEEIIYRVGLAVEKLEN